MNRETMRRILERHGISRVVGAEPGGMAATATLLESPKVILWSLLDSWVATDEAEATEDAVERLKDRILDVFKEFPGQADGWFQEWRRANPSVKLI